MDAQEVADEDRDRDERVEQMVADSEAVLAADPVNGLWYLIGCKRPEDRLGMAVGIDCAYAVLHGLEPACHRIAQMAVEDLVQMKDAA